MTASNTELDFFYRFPLSLLALSWRKRSKYRRHWLAKQMRGQMRFLKPFRFSVLISSIQISNPLPCLDIVWLLCLSPGANLSWYKPWSSLTPRTPHLAEHQHGSPGTKHHTAHFPTAEPPVVVPLSLVAAVLGPSWAWRRRRYAEAAGLQALQVLSGKEERFTWATWIWKENMYENVFFKRHPLWLHEMKMMQFSACFIIKRKSLQLNYATADVYMTLWAAQQETPLRPGHQWGRTTCDPDAGNHLVGPGNSMEGMRK